MVRIQCGKLRGRVLKTPKGHEIRPTSAYMRELVFNLIGPDRIEGSHFLDLCAGCGGMGFEAISRGASEVYLVDSSRNICNLLHENAEKLNIENEVKIICLRFQQIGRMLLKTPKLYKYFDFVYLDPPYGKEKPDALIHSINGLVEIIKDDGVIFVESYTRLTNISFPLVCGEYICIDERHNATTQLTKWIFNPEFQKADNFIPE